jgi:type I restriction enzyme S subunit
MKHPQVPLGEVADFVNGAAFKPEDWGEDGLPIIRIQNLTDSDKPFNYTECIVPEKLVVNPGDLLVSWSATLGVFQWNGPKGLLNQHIFRVLPNDEVVDKNYLKHTLGQAINDMERHLHGATMKHVNRGEFLGTRIPLPPLEEQGRIAAILDKASAIRSCSEKAARNAADIKASLFDEAFIAHDRHGHWEQLALGELCEVQGGLQVTSARPAMPIRVPYLRVANVLRGRLDLAEIKEINCSQSELDRTRLQPKDLLVVEGHGNPNEIGRVAMWTEQPGEMVHQNHLIRVRSKASSLDPEFLCFYLNSRMGRRHLLKRANTTSGLNTISTSVVKSAPIIVPPIDEQRSFCETIKNIAQLEASLLVSSALHAQLFRSLLSESLDK